MRIQVQDKTTPTTRPLRAFLAGALALLMLSGGLTAFGPASAQSPLGPILDSAACASAFGVNHEDDPAQVWDYGDAPDSGREGGGLDYPTRYQGGGNPLGYFPTLSDTINAMSWNQPGARHRVVDVAWLGDGDLYGIGADFEPLHPADLPPTVERDGDTFPDDDLTTTNLDPNAQTPDHDGRDNGLAPTALSTYTSDHIMFRVSTNPGIQRWYVNVLVDWDFDGRWFGTDANGAPEWALQNHPISVNPLESRLFSAPIQVGSTPGTPWTRLTLTPFPIITDTEPMDWDGSVPEGYVDQYGQEAFSCGETEDHCGSLQIFERNETDLPAIRCQEQPDEPPQPVKCAGPGEIGVASYDIDISTGFGNVADQQMAVYDEDEHWHLVHHPTQGNGHWPVYALQAHPDWQQPAHGQWVNPFGDAYHGKVPGWEHDFENNWYRAPFGTYTYRGEFSVNDPNALHVSFDFDWWRDGDTYNPSTFRYYEDWSGNWVDFSTGVGYAPASRTQAAFTDLGAQQDYIFEVDVVNHITFMGLLVEGTMTVHCGGIQYEDPDTDWFDRTLDDLLKGP